MYKKAVELAEANGWFLARQFETKANAAIHEATTAREIINDFAGSRLDYFVTGYGTGGTVVGVARVLRRERPETRIVLSEPANAQLVGSGQAAGARRRRRAGRKPSGLRAAPDPGLDAGFHSVRPAGGDRCQPLRRGDADRRRRGHQMGEGAGAEGRHLHRHLRRLRLSPWRARSPSRRRAGLGDPVHASRYRRALHDDAAVRRHRGRDE